MPTPAKANIGIIGVGCEALLERFPGSKYADHDGGNVELQGILRDIFRTRTTAEWLAFAGEHNTIIATVNTPKTVIDDPQFIDRFQWTTVQDTGIEQLIFPLHIAGEELPVPATAPTIGQHSDAVLKRSSSAGVEPFCGTWPGRSPTAYPA